MSDANLLLRQTYSFSADDVETNRRAELTADQQKIIDIGQSFIRTSADAYSKTSPRLVIWLVILLVFAVGAAAFFFGDSLKQIVQQLGALALPSVGGIILLVVLLLWYAQRSARSSMEMYRAMGDPTINKPVVHGIEGRVELVKDEVHANSGKRDILDRGRVLQTYFYAKVRSSYETIKISIPEKDMNPFEPQRTYRIFYVETVGTRSFLSAEVVN